MDTSDHEFILGGIAAAVPEERLDNETLAARLGMSAPEILRRTGIAERRVAARHESASTLGARAARDALDRAGLAASEIDLLVLSTYTPDHLLCPTSPAIAHAIGAERAGTFDLNAACSGGVTALMTASGLLGRPFRNVLVVTSDLSTRYVRRDEPKTAMVFGDGASAMLLRRAGDLDARPWRILAADLGADGAGATLFRVPDGGSARRPLNGRPHPEVHSIEMDGRAVFRFAVDRGIQVVEELCRRAGFAPHQIDHVIPHQANLRIIHALAERTEIPAERWFSNIARYGNTASSSIPIALAELIEGRQVRPGQRILLVAFGAGLTWAGLALEAGSVMPSGH